MALWDNVQLSFETWTSGFGATEGAILGGIGCGLMVFAVAALLVQRHLERRVSKSNHVSVPARASAAVLGVRHCSADIPEDQSGKFSKKSKKDPFLSRLDRLA
jgi:hypothetical protein